MSQSLRSFGNAFVRLGKALGAQAVVKGKALTVKASDATQKVAVKMDSWASKLELPKTKAELTEAEVKAKADALVDEKKVEVHDVEIV